MSKQEKCQFSICLHFEHCDRNYDYECLEVMDNDNKRFSIKLPIKPNFNMKLVKHMEEFKDGNERENH